MRSEPHNCNKCQNDKNVERIPKDEENSVESVSTNVIHVEPHLKDKDEDNTWGLYIPVDDNSFQILSKGIFF